MKRHENQATKTTQPWLYARPIRQCETCGRDLPRRAHRKECATCLKTKRAYPHTWASLIKGAA